MKSSLIQLNIGDPVLYEDGEILTIRHIRLVPNGKNDPELVTLVFAERKNGNLVSATSNRFKPAPDHEYPEFYPSVFINQINKA
jgi:hypothetical protein